jgi:predicted transcriptional regulator YdeE
MKLLVTSLLLGAAQWNMTTLNDQQVIGIEARTTNAREMTADGIIGKQWTRFMKDNLLARIPNKADSAIVALYTDYESDKDGAYTFVLGARVSSVASIPGGMVARKVPAGRYAVFTSDRGPVARVVYETWKRIWAAPLERVYRTDFEVYDERAADPQNTQISVYVGVHDNR